MMDMLKRSLAPITDAMWNEIDEQAASALRLALTARKFVDVTGPTGWDYAAIGLGRLNVPEDQPEDDVKYGVHLVQPLVETRISFKLDLWELDNIERGAKDVELDALEEAARKIARFEDKVIYHGFEDGEILGLLKSTKLESLQFKKNPKSLIHTLSEGITALGNASIEGPYALVINQNTWADVVSETQGYPLKQHIKNLSIDSVILNDAVEGGLLLSTRGGDFELILGHDLALGYEGHDATHVQFFLAESFTFRVLEPNALVRLEI